MKNRSAKFWTEPTTADVSDREQICCVDNAPDDFGYALSKMYPPPGTLKDIEVKQKKQ